MTWRGVASMMAAGWRTRDIPMWTPCTIHHDTRYTIHDVRRQDSRPAAEPPPSKMSGSVCTLQAPENLFTALDLVEWSERGAHIVYLNVCIDSLSPPYLATKPRLQKERREEGGCFIYGHKKNKRRYAPCHIESLFSARRRRRRKKQNQKKDIVSSNEERVRQACRQERESSSSSSKKERRRHDSKKKNP